MNTVGQNPAGQIRIAAADQGEVSMQATFGVYGPGGLDRGTALIARTYECERGRRGEQFRIGGGNEELVRVLRIQNLTGGQGDNFYAPEPASHVGVREDGGDLCGKNVRVDGVQARGN